MQRVLNAFKPKPRTVNAVYLRGVIGSRAGPRGIAFSNVKEQLEAAFKVGGTVGWVGGLLGGSVGPWVVGSVDL